MSERKNLEKGGEMAPKTKKSVVLHETSGRKKLVGTSEEGEPSE